MCGSRYMHEGWILSLGSAGGGTRKKMRMMHRKSGPLETADTLSSVWCMIRCGHEHKRSWGSESWYVWGSGIAVSSLQSHPTSFFFVYFVRTSVEYYVTLRCFNRHLHFCYSKTFWDPRKNDFFMKSTSWTCTRNRAGFRTRVHNIRVA